MMDRRKYLAILSVVVISSLYMNVCKAEVGRGGGIASFLALLLMMALIGGFVIVILVIVYKLRTRKKEKTEQTAPVSANQLTPKGKSCPKCGKKLR